MSTLPRIWRSPHSHFGHNGPDLEDETVTANAVYTDGVLADIARRGFDAIWVHGLLHHLVRSKVFPEFGKNAGQHQHHMRALIERAARNGLRVYLYMQPPRGFDTGDEFWISHPDVRGAASPWQTDEGTHTIYHALCSSTQPVKDFLFSGSASLGRELPGLGGVILITASEYPSHCYAKYPLMEYRAQGLVPVPPLGCARCEQRRPEEVIGEVIRLVRDGLMSTNPEAQVIAWNWSWSFLEPDPCPGILKALPETIALLVDFERGDSRVILGKERVLDEYSLSFAGPSKRFLTTYQLARDLGLPVMAKLQIGTTHELATVPNLPLIGNLYEKAVQLRALDVRGFMGCWNFGSMPSANASAFNTFHQATELTSRAGDLQSFAREYFGDCDTEMVVRAWETFSEAMGDFPFSIPFIYMAPTNYALALPLKPGPLTGVPAGRSWLDDARGDDLSACLDRPYTLEEIRVGLGRVAGKWKRGARLLTYALQHSSTKHAREETANAWVCYHVWRSTLNSFRAYALRLHWKEENMAAFRRIAAVELRNLRAALPYVASDSRFGFHSEAGAYLYDAQGIWTKILSLEKEVSREVS